MKQPSLELIMKITEVVRDGQMDRRRGRPAARWMMIGKPEIPVRVIYLCGLIVDTKLLAYNQLTGLS